MVGIYLQSNENKDKKRAVYIRVRTSSGSFTISTGIRATAKDWNKKAQKLRPLTELECILNSKLAKKRELIETSLALHTAGIIDFLELIGEEQIMVQLPRYSLRKCRTKCSHFNIGMVYRLRCCRYWHIAMPLKVIEDVYNDLKQKGGYSVSRKTMPLKVVQDVYNEMYQKGGHNGRPSNK